MINLKEVAAAIGLEAPAQKLVDMTCDSRKVNPGDLFIALNGYNFDARTKIAEVCAKGPGRFFTLIRRTLSWMKPSFKVKLLSLRLKISI